ncbi:hypothetical protein HAX54_030640, partial [Datura stramonium]|nr:hypothetical protein [Datura stramonium]
SGLGGGLHFRSAASKCKGVGGGGAEKGAQGCSKKKRKIDLDRESNDNQRGSRGGTGSSWPLGHYKHLFSLILMLVSLTIQ